MKDYKITLKLTSSVGTPFQADTIFGHLCWAYRYIKGELKLRKFLDEYEQAPQLLVSDGFPEGFLPVPSLKCLFYKELKDLSGKYYSGQVKAMSVIKRLFQRRWLSVPVWEMAKENLSQRLLAEKCLKMEVCPKTFDLRDKRCTLSLEKCPQLSLQELTLQEKNCCIEKEEDEREETILRTSIDRLTGQAKEGRLYETKERFYIPGARFSIFIRSWDLTLEDIKELFEYIALSGYGRDKSTGKGRVSLEEIKNGFSLPSVDRPNAFVTLSSYIPQREDPLEGYYKIITKYGKLGEEYASSRIISPFKKPILMFAAGSLFKLGKSPINDWYGGLVSDIHHEKSGIKQYGYALPIGVRIDEDI
ncbi:hypothetical protein KKG19_05685 [Patescibacteria group bacterium]|nr:hypothetical protein [Patescibacteria group bacterium]